MTRTFHHKFTIGSKAGVILFAGLAIYLFWIKAIIPGLLLIVLNVLLMERVLHSEYVFTDDTLIINRGRFAKRHSIPLAEIHSCKPMNTIFGMVHYLLIGYGSERMEAVQPYEETSFLNVLRNRVAAAKQTDKGGEA